MPDVVTIPGLRMSALDLIKSSLRLVGALESGETPDSESANDALMILNQMIDSWSIERLMIFNISRITQDLDGNTLAMIPGQQTYKVGPGGDFNMARPVRITNIGMINLNNAAQPLELPVQMLTDEQWAAIPVKNIQSTIPLTCWDTVDPIFHNLNFWCIPSIVANVALYIWAQLTQFADLPTKFSFPPGYPLAMRYNLAVLLAPEFSDGKGASPSVMETAVSSKALIKSFNSPIVDLRCDEALTSGGYYNIYSDTVGYR